MPEYMVRQATTTSTSCRTWRLASKARDHPTSLYTRGLRIKQKIYQAELTDNSVWAQGLRVQFLATTNVFATSKSAISIDKDKAWNITAMSSGWASLQWRCTHNEPRFKTRQTHFAFAKRLEICNSAMLKSKEKEKITIRANPNGLVTSLPCSSEVLCSILGQPFTSRMPSSPLNL